MNQIGEYLVEAFKHAREIGSLQTIERKDYKAFAEYLLNLDAPNAQLDIFSTEWLNNVKPLMLQFTRQASILSNKYAVVCTNPPYMNKLEGHLKAFVVDNYKAYSGDLFSVFMYRNFGFCKNDGYSAFMTPFVWMFIRQYEKLRRYLISEKSITTLIQMEYSAYEEATVPICTFVLKNKKSDETGIYIKLSDFKGGMKVQKQKVVEALKNWCSCTYVYEKKNSRYKNICGWPIAFWASAKIENIFMTCKPFEEFATIRVGMHTGNNDIFLREWYEVDKENIAFDCLSHDESKTRVEKWYPYNKGGGTRKWYGYRTKVVNWQFGGLDIHKFHGLPMNYNGAPVRAKGLQFLESITWSDIGSTGNFGCRYTEPGAMFDVKGSSAFVNDKKLLKYTMAFLNSNIVSYLLQMLNPTISYQVGNISALPFIIPSEEIINKVESLVDECIYNERIDWNENEISWEYKTHPLLLRIKENHGKIKEICKAVSNEKNERFEKELLLENELNSIFMGLYGIGDDELSSEVQRENIHIKQADIINEVKTLISYAVGCMFGRYSLDCEGIIYAGGKWDDSKYETFIPDKDNCIPITDDEYSEDDIVGRLCEWIEKVYGFETLEENLDFIAKALGNKGKTSRETIREYFVNDFITDHMRIYQKRPIYWLFDSGKANGFKALVYIHRYNSDTVAKVRVDYLHNIQKSIEQAKLSAEYLRDNGSGAEKAKATKLITKYTKQLAEIRLYDEAMAHIANQRIDIDLDDGVKVNYEKFQGVEVAQEGKKALKVNLLAKIK